MTLNGEFPAGAAANGDFNLAYAGSIADALETLLEEPSLARSWWLRARPRDASTSTDPPTLLNVDLSTDGHRTFPTDAEEIQLYEALLAPYSVQVGIEGLWGVARMTFGEIVIGNPGGDYTHLAGEDWVGRQADVYVGPRGGAMVQFGRVGRLLSRQIQWDRSTLTIPVDDYSFLFDAPVQDSSYLGSSSVTGTGISFNSGTNLISAAGSDLSVFSGYRYVKVAGSVSNNKKFRISSAASGSIQVDAALTGLVTEAAGASVTITGYLDGADEIKGRPKPLLFGVKRQFEPILVSGPDHVYQIHEGAIQAVDAVLDQGVALSFGGNVTDITLATPAPGEYFTCLATGHIALGEAPAGTVTCTARGHNSSAYGYVDDVVGLTKLLTVEYAGLNDPSELDSAALDSLSSYTAPMGHYTGIEPQSVRSVLERWHNSAASWAWLQPAKILTVGRIMDPDGEAAEFALDVAVDDLRWAPWSMQPFEIPVGRVRVGFRRYPRTLRDSDLAGAVPEETRKDYGEEYRFAIAEDPAIFVQTPEADEIEILTDLDLESDAQALANEQLALRKVPRRLGTISPAKGMIKRGVGAVFSLKDDRLPISPKNFVILGLQNEAAKSGDADVIVWRCFG